MNNRGQLAIVGLMIGIMAFLVGMITVGPLGDVMDEQRSASNLDCDNSSISDGSKMACLVLDLTIPYWIAIIFAMAGAYVTARYVIG